MQNRLRSVCNGPVNLSSQYRLNSEVPSLALDLSDGAIKINRKNQLTEIRSQYSLVSIKPIKTTTTTNLKIKQSDQREG